MVFILLWAFLLIFLACGKKGPPFLPKENISLRVEQLSAELQDGIIILKGHLIDIVGKNRDTSGDLGCQVYYAGYSLENSPCKGCPIQYRPIRGTGEEHIVNQQLTCKILGKKRRGMCCITH